MTESIESVPCCASRASRASGAIAAKAAKAAALAPVPAVLAGEPRGGPAPAAASPSRRRRLTAAAALAAAVIFTATGCDKIQARQLIKKGNAHFKEQQYEQALVAYQKAHELDPNEVRLLKFVAMGQMALYNPGSTHPKDIEACLLYTSPSPRD